MKFYSGYSRGQNPIAGSCWAKIQAIDVQDGSALVGHSHAAAIAGAIHETIGKGLLHPIPGTLSIIIIHEIVGTSG